MCDTLSKAEFHGPPISTARVVHKLLLCLCYLRFDVSGFEHADAAAAAAVAAAAAALAAFATASAICISR